ncbi:MAG: T9SS type B sorting domain-containing protein [Flavobacteriales bacterium]|nr:T9SS type B sorting domain-containing protein [Flavobacteriales bacterium]
MYKTIVLLFSLLILSPNLFSQSLVFAELVGTPTMNTTGWNLTGAAAVGDTGGDTDSNSDELILTNNVNGSSGGVFYNQPIDLATCYQWNVDFYFRINDGSGADGLAFCFLDVPPTGFVSGGGVGIPQTANGIKVIFDTYDNGCGANPEIQIYNGVGYGECNAGIVKVNNVGGNLNFLRSSGYNRAIINYNNGVITVSVNGTQWLSTNYTVSFVGYMGFTASTGGSNDRHSIKNARIYADIAEPDAGPDISICSGSSGQIGVTNNPNYVYSWSPSAGLNQTNISNPTVTLTNTGTTPITQTFTVTTTLASNPTSCPVSDQVVVTVKPIIYNTINTSVCQGGSYTVGGQTFSTAGQHQATVTAANGCDSVITLNLSFNPVLTGTIIQSICQGGSYVFFGQTLSNPGVYSQTLQNAAGCDSIVTLNLTMNPVLSSTQNVAICPGSSHTFFGQTLTNAGSYSQSLQNAAGCDSIVYLNLSIKPTTSSTITHAMCDGLSYNFNGQTITSAGSYTATLVGSNGCDSVVTLLMTIYPIPAAPVLSSNSPLLCPGDQLNLNAEFIDFASYSWTGPNNFTSTQQNNSFNAFPVNMGNYSATLSVNGCVSPSASIPVTITNIFNFEDFIFPNVITPDNDGINDKLDIQSYFYTCYEFELFIYNRWGNLVFSHKFNEDPFEGKTADGTDLSDGVYFYKLVFDEGSKSGYFHIVR